MQPVIHFGYRFQWSVSDDSLEEDQIRDTIALNDILPEPIFVTCIRPIDIESHHYNVILGISVDETTDLDFIYSQRASLDEFVSGHPFLEGFHFSENPRFYCGLPWVISDASSSITESLEEDTSIDSELEEVSDLSTEEDS